MSRVLDFDPKIRNVQTLVPKNEFLIIRRHRKKKNEKYYKKLVVVLNVSLAIVRFSDQKSGQKPDENLAENLAKCPFVWGPKSQVCETLSGGQRCLCLCEAPWPMSSGPKIVCLGGLG